jgi:glycosyltransferase involved in cell wall biosynthesis
VDGIAPDVSVVVPTRNRPDLLRSLLNALAAQATDRLRFEVIVADDGSAEPTRTLLARAPEEMPYELTVVRLDGAGAPAARNAAWRVARAPLIAFTDDDCQPAPQWLEAGVRAWGGDPQRVVQGRTRPAGGLTLTDLSPLQHSVDVAQLTPEVETCNVFYSRALLEEVGGFDEGIRVGEDMELAWSARERGAEIVFEPNALVEHAVVEVTPAEALRKVWGWTEAMRPFARHPDLRRARLMKGVFWNWSHYLIVRALLGLPFARRRMAWPIALWLAWPLLVFELRKSRQTGGLHLAPFWLLRDLVETAAVVRGAIRYRTVVI